MKEKLQKYLAGEREGFSLVELIIVIAIMAILVGVVTLAVLPNIEKSKESKDFAALDSALSALNSAVASSQTTTGDSFELSTGSTGVGEAAAFTGTKKTIATQVLELMGKGTSGISLSSNAATASGNKIKFAWTMGTGTADIKISVSVVNGSSVVPSKYNGNFEVTN